MNFKGTPGEWEVKHSQSKSAFNIVGTVLGSKYKIARCPYSTFENNKILSEKEKRECEANALLMSEAPNLLKALQNMVLSAKAGYTSFADISCADLAIQKALISNSETNQTSKV